MRFIFIRNSLSIICDLHMYKTSFFVDITISPPGGVYFTALSAKGLDKDEKDKEGKYIRRERYAGNASRSFYVGNNVQREDIHPKFENGILSFTVPKEQTAVENSSHYIAIEG